MNVVTVVTLNSSLKSFSSSSSVISGCISLIFSGLSPRFAITFAWGSTSSFAILNANSTDFIKPPLVLIIVSNFFLVAGFNALYTPIKADAEKRSTLAFPSLNMNTAFCLSFTICLRLSTEAGTATSFSLISSSPNIIGALFAAPYPLPAPNPPFLDIPNAGTCGEDELLFFLEGDLA